MTAKTVALDTEAYELLLRSKKPGETFSEVVRRTLRPPSRISDLAGSLDDLATQTWTEIDRERTRHRRRDQQRRKRLERTGGGG
jgi:predicted CopG family antitoxin